MKWNRIIILIVLMFSLLAGSTLAANTDNTDDYVSIFAQNSTGSVTLNGDYSSAPVNFSIGPPANETWIISRLIVHLEDGNGLVASKYGKDITLTNGISIRLVQQDRIYNLTNGFPILSNAQWARFSYDVSFTTFGAGNDFMDVRWTFSKSGTFIKLDGSKNETIQVVLNDDFTGLVDHTFDFQGYKLQTGSESMTSVAIIMVFSLIALCVLVSLFVVKKEWMKTLLLMVMAILMSGLLRLVGIFARIVYPTETNLINLLDSFYSISVGLLLPLAGIGIVVVIVQIIKSMSEWKKRKNNPDWEMWNDL